MGNCKDTYELANKCIRGHLLTKKLHQTDEEKKHIIDGLKSEEELIKIFDKFVNCDSKTNTPTTLSKEATKPHTQKYSQVIDHDQDIELLINTLQHHTCKIGGCQKTINGELKPCRFKFPMEKSERTIIRYENTQRKPTDPDKWELHIVPKRANNDRISSHNLYQLQHWRANVDFCIVHDYNKVIQYVAKYASKAETKSNAYKAAFEEIFTSTNESVETKTGLRKVITRV